ncbi:MAG: translation initiation factor IF-2 [Sedimentisphaerales bacterium]|nr:translation initiation factor IF-2 [Sedimentisphaerales bacterium]
MAKRVFQLAKELGVKSTAMVAKCQAEGVDIKNHMSTLSAGLEATIREWFSTGENATTVETTAKVDLDKVKTKTKRRKKKKAADKGEESTTAVAVAEPEVQTLEPLSGQTEETMDSSAIALPKTVAVPGKTAVPKRKSPKELEAEKAAVHVEPSSPEAESAPAVAAEETAGIPEETTAPPVPDSPVISRITPGKKVEPPPPKPFVPAPAVLQGPRVIRTDPMESVPSPPPGKPSRRKTASSAVADISQLDISTELPTHGTRRKRKGKDSEVEESEKELGKRSKQRSVRSRGGRKYESTVDAIGPHEWGDRDLYERQQRLAQASSSKLHRRERQIARQDYTVSGSTSLVTHRRIDKATVKEPITVKELSAAIGVRAHEIMAKLMELGVMVNINQALEADAAVTVALEFGVELTVEQQTLLWDKLQNEYDARMETGAKETRPPVVAFLGHVDHGKTSLLDRIRKASVVSGEAGGITQHIGSYLHDDGRHRIAFLDTPGHKAFTEMRARGANMTDILVLVIAADDGVMPQTEEAINHAKAAEVPILVALNKIDLPDIDINRVLGQLSEKGLVPVEWGGETEVVRTSALTGEGIDDLLDHIEYLAELHHLTAAPDGSAIGWIVESKMTSQQGVIARLLVESGTLKPGDIIISGCAHGRIRTISDATGENLTEAGPSSPVVVTGMDEVPVAGDRFYVIDSISQAAEIANEQKDQRRERKLAQRNMITLDNLFSEIEAGELKELNVIVKADVQGSVDVLCNTIMEMNTSEVAVKILHAAVGGISESDVLLAQASNAIIIGFQVIPDDHARHIAEREGVEIRLYRVIYQISEDIKKALEGMLEPRIEEKPLGRAEVRQIFRVSRIGVIAGCIILDGIINRSARLRLIRDNVVIRDDNPVESLRRIRDDVSEVRSGMECGIKLAGFDDVKVGDLLEAYELIEVSRTLDSVE